MLQLYSKDQKFFSFWYNDKAENEYIINMKFESRAAGLFIYRTLSVVTVSLTKWKVSNSNKIITSSYYQND